MDVSGYSEKTDKIKEEGIMKLKSWELKTEWDTITNSFEGQVEEIMYSITPSFYEDLWMPSTWPGKIKQNPKKALENSVHSSVAIAVRAMSTSPQQ